MRVAEITFVRHGQARTGAKTEADYDNLSDIGLQQADWVAEHFAQTGRSFDRIITGTLNRQRDTGAAIATRLGLTLTQDNRLNEMDYFGLAHSMNQRFGVVQPTDRPGFVAHVPQVIQAWAKGQLCPHLESFDAFKTRVTDLLTEAGEDGGRTLYVSSTGVIVMAMKVNLNLTPDTFAKVILQVYNSSIHRFSKVEDVMAIECFNAIPHLEDPSRHAARTHI